MQFRKAFLVSSLVGLCFALVFAVGLSLLATFSFEAPIVVAVTVIAYTLAILLSDGTRT